MNSRITILQASVQMRAYSSYYDVTHYDLGSVPTGAFFILVHVCMFCIILLVKKIYLLWVFFQFSPLIKCYL